MSKAEWIARKAHRHQQRWDGSPYIKHPEAVASAVHGHLRKQIAWLHDVAEDTIISLDILRVLFDDPIVDAVDAMTRRKDEQYSDFIMRVSQNEFAVDVKIADIEHNLINNDREELVKRYEKALVFLKEIG